MGNYGANSWMRIAGARLKKATMVAVLAVGLPAGSVASYCGVVILSGNLHTVEEGRVYRSAQLDRAGFERVIAEHHIKSILNLRGPNADQAWYQDEIAVTSELGVAHYDFALSARRQVAPARMRELVELVRNAPKPLLIHCRSGADRTGLAAALYRYSIQGKSPEDAAAELSLRYAHFPWLTSKTIAMDQSFGAWLELPRTSIAAGGG
jgi:protein tyrosine/serine phosphatase